MPVLAQYRWMLDGAKTTRELDRLYRKIDYEQCTIAGPSSKRPVLALRHQSNGCTTVWSFISIASWKSSTLHLHEISDITWQKNTLNVILMTVTRTRLLPPALGLIGAPSVWANDPIAQIVALTARQRACKSTGKEMLRIRLENTHTNRPPFTYNVNLIHVYQKWCWSKRLVKPSFVQWKHRVSCLKNTWEHVSIFMQTSHEQNGR